MANRKGRFAMCNRRFANEMTNERWADVVSSIKEKFTALESGERALDPGPGTVAFIEFERKDGVRMRLERTTRPLVTGKKTIGSRRIGSTTSVHYEYSDTETTSSVKAYQWDKATEVFVPLEIDAEIFTA